MKTISIKERFGVATAIGISGALVAQAIALNSPHFVNDPGFVRCAGAGAFVAGFVLAGGFGKDGWAGWLWAALTFIAATIVGAGLATTFLPLDHVWAQFDFADVTQTMLANMLLGPIYVAEMVLSKAAVLLPWVGSVLGIRLLALYLRDTPAPETKTLQ